MSYLAGLLARIVQVEELHGRRRWIWFGHGRCCKSSSMDTAYVREHRYAYGRLYPVKLAWGTLVPPGDAAKPSGEGNVYMCRYHAAVWLGHDPVTQEQWAWGSPAESV